MIMTINWGGSRRGYGRRIVQSRRWPVGLVVRCPHRRMWEVDVGNVGWGGAFCLMSAEHVSGGAACPSGEAARKGLGGVVLPDGSVPKRSGGSLRPQGGEGGRTGGNSTPPGGA